MSKNNLTIVYILISTDKDLYYEQALVSLHSLKVYNPESQVVLLVDKRTDDNLADKRRIIREYVTEVKVISVPEEYSPKERSRYIKTTFRKYLKGNLLFIDTDTVITGFLGDIDEAVGNADIACVPDYHAPIRQLIDGPQIIKRMQYLFGEDASDETVYFNSGVMFIRDTPEATVFFEQWHRFWETAVFQKKQCYDQPAMLMANRRCGHIIRELPGIYNCQILTSFQYLHKAKIIHFFNNNWEGKENLSPFFEESLYLSVKQTGRISACIESLIRNCKSSFLSPTYFTSPQRVEFLNNIVGATLYSAYKKKNVLYRILLTMCKCRWKIIKFITKFNDRSCLRSVL